VAWIAHDNARAAKEQRVAVRHAAKLIGEHPDMGKQQRDLTPETVWFLVLRGFPYVLVYRANAVPPRVLRVLHGARDLPDVQQDLERG